MQNQHLTNLLKTFSSEEWKKFPHFVESPFFKLDHRAELNTLFKAIQKHYERKQTFPTSPALWKKVKKGKPFNKGQMANRLTELHRAARCFLAYYNYEQTDSFWINQLADYTDRDLDYHFNTVYDKLSKQQEKRIAKSEQDYFIAYEGKRWCDIVKGKNDPSFDRAEHIQAMLLDLDYSYLLGKLKYYYFLLGKSKESVIYQPDYQAFCVYLHQVISDHQKRTQPLPPLLILYYQMLKSIKQDKGEDAEKIIQQLMSNFKIYKDSLTKRDRSNVQQHLINYYIRQSNRNDITDKRKLFESYKCLINIKTQNGLLVNEEGKVNYRNYRNTVLTALQVAKNAPDYQQDMSWAKDFIETYSCSSYPAEYENSIYHYLLAKWYFQQKDWKMTEIHLGKMDRLAHGISTDQHFYLWYHALLITTLYEKKPVDTYFDTIAKRFYHSVRRTKKLRTATQKTYENFGRFVLRLAKINNHAFKNQLRSAQKLQTTIQQTERVACKSWLLQKLKEMIN